MIKMRFTPGLLVMTILALVTEAVAMDIFYRMACDTLFRRVLVAALNMA